MNRMQAGRRVTSDIGGPRVDALGLEVEATQVAGGSGDFVGVRCYTAEDANEGYQLGISPADRVAAVGAFRGEDFRLLESSREGSRPFVPQVRRTSCESSVPPPARGRPS